MYFTCLQVVLSHRILLAVMLARQNEYVQLLLPDLLVNQEQCVETESHHPEDPHHLDPAAAPELALPILR